MIAVVDYDTGNLCSVCNALGRIGAQYCVTSNIDTIRSADRVLLPGVGEASSAMEKLRERDLCRVIKQLSQPVLGICIGMQLMCRSSEEGNAECLGIFDTAVRRFLPNKEEGVKVPHMGWNSIENLRSPLFKGVSEGAFVYFVHSFAADINDDCIAKSANGRQFHPEKSGDIGDAVLRNFMNL